MLGGAFNRVNGEDYRRVARLNPDGSLDESFDPGTGADNSVSSVVLQPDGRVLIGGFFTRVDGIDRNRIARLNADGSLDFSFDPGTGASMPVFSVALQADGKVLIGGPFNWVGGAGREEIARLHADGSVDLGFNAGPAPTGMVLPMHAVAVQDDGQILAGGAHRLDRFNPDGTLDGDCHANRGPNQSVLSLALQPDGKLLMAGLFSRAGGTARNQIARLHSDGSVDDTFHPGLGPNSGVSSLAVKPDGGILAGGVFSSVDGVTRNGIARLNGDGTLDDGFIPALNAGARVASIVIQKDGKILWAGNSPPMAPAASPA
jgi:uncharacterized delta-60 repeat protein